MKRLPNYIRIPSILLSIFMILYWTLLTLMHGTISFAWVFAVGGCSLLVLTLCDRFWMPFWFAIVKPIRIMILIMISCLAVCFISVEGYLYYIGNTSSNTYGDTILVLGAGLHKGNQISASLKYRLDKAIEVHKKTPDAYIVVSGGQGEDELLSEAEAMKQYLKEKGIDEQLILMEDASTTTSENMAFSKEVMTQHQISSKRISLITNDFHMLRAITYAQKEGFDVSRHPSDGLWTTQLCFYTREFFGMLRLWLLQY